MNENGQCFGISWDFMCISGHFIGMKPVIIGFTGCNGDVKRFLVGVFVVIEKVIF